MKKRSEQEIEEIIKDFLEDQPLIEISQKHGIGEVAIYRIIQKHFGRFNDRSVPKKNKIQRLEKQLVEREKEIALLKAALKKYWTCACTRVD